MTYRTSVSEILEKDFSIFVFIPASFQTFANALVQEALLDHKLDAITLLESALKPGKLFRTGSSGTELVLVRWTIGAICAWQLIDRRIDELRLLVIHTVIFLLTWVV